MATINGYTAEKMQEIMNEVIENASIIAGHLILTRHDGSTVDVGNVQGPQGIQGPEGPSGLTNFTSTTRPSSPADGRMIYETDTKRVMVFNSATSTWVAISRAQIGSRGALVGSSLPSTGLILEQSGNDSVTLTSGSGTITYPVSFPNGVTSVQVANSRADLQPGFVNNYDHALGSFKVYAETNAGVAITGTMVVSWIAKGW